jgi:hypothetical protein
VVDTQHAALGIRASNGNIVYYLHGDTYQVSMDASVSVGQYLAQGSYPCIWQSGGSCAGTHLHLEIHNSIVGALNTDDIDPESWLESFPNGSLTHVIGTSSGAIYRQVGGAPLLLTNCGYLTGNCTAIDVPNLGAYPIHPAEGTLIWAASGSPQVNNWYRVVGGAPLLLSSCSYLTGACNSAIQVNQATITTDTAHLSAIPSNSTLALAVERAS